MLSRRADRGRTETGCAGERANAVGRGRAALSLGAAAVALVRQAVAVVVEAVAELRDVCHEAAREGEVAARAGEDPVADAFVCRRRRGGAEVAVGPRADAAGGARDNIAVLDGEACGGCECQNLREDLRLRSRVEGAHRNCAAEEGRGQVAVAGGVEPRGACHQLHRVGRAGARHTVLHDGQGTEPLLGAAQASVGHGVAVENGEAHRAGGHVDGAAELGERRQFGSLVCRGRCSGGGISRIGQ